MSELVFKPKGHKYYLDGEEIPSVSEVTRFLSREVYGEIDQIALDRAAERGTLVHKATETLDTKGYVEAPSEIDGYIQAYLKFRKEHAVEWELIEHMTHMEADYAGTIDRYGTVDGERCILDIKTSKTISKEHQVMYTAAQNMYRTMLEDEGKQVDKLYILQLKANGTYKLIKLPIDFGLLHSCLTIHAAFQAAKPKKKPKH